eukprot:TRINITY_DN238_c0_g1_i1.p1 TRINITY_DN238_c0_g1~~TRINITY_DN238_c0_g1_i1.p1  ORF type:complete len:319 (-),score=65.13 TRINITY_DN238_c0_g1_i1:131-1039(-)
MWGSNTRGVLVGRCSGVMRAPVVARSSFSTFAACPIFVTARPSVPFTSVTRSWSPSTWSISHYSTKNEENSEEPEYQNEQQQSREQSTTRQPPSPELIARSVFVRNIGFESSEADLQALFPNGKLQIVRDKFTETPRFAFVEFESPEEAQKALSVNDTELGGRPLQVLARTATNTDPRRNRPRGNYGNYNASEGGSYQRRGGYGSYGGQDRRGSYGGQNSDASGSGGGYQRRERGPGGYGNQQRRDNNYNASEGGSYQRRERGSYNAGQERRSYNSGGDEYGSQRREQRSSGSNKSYGDDSQ